MTSLDYCAIEDLLTDAERAARDRLRRFVQEEIMPERWPGNAYRRRAIDSRRII